MEPSFFSNLFEFPVLLADFRQQDLGLPNEDVAYIIGKVELPYQDFSGISDRWLPTAESKELAESTGKFEACSVNFGMHGEFVVPMTRAQFKKKLQAFVDDQPKTRQGVMIIKNKEDMMKFYGMEDPQELPPSDGDDDEQQ